MISFFRFGSRRQHLKRTHFLNEQVRVVMDVSFVARPQYRVDHYYSKVEIEEVERRTRLVEIRHIAREIRERNAT